MLEVSDGDRSVNNLTRILDCQHIFSCTFPLSPVHLVKSITLVSVNLQPLPPKTGISSNILTCTLPYPAYRNFCPF